MQTLESLQQEIDRLTLENQRLRLCPCFEVYTRAAIEISWQSMLWADLAVIYADLDNLKALNSRHGHEGANTRIKSALGQVRSSEILSGRWYSGDEFVFIVPAIEANQATARIQQLFRDQGLSATFGIARCICPDLLECVANAQFLVERSKTIGKRDAIVSTV